MKTCTKHGILTEDKIYTWKYKGKTMRRCHQCILDKNKRAHDIWMQNPENVKKKRERDNERYKNKRAEIVAKRQSPEGKAKRRQWYKEHAPEYQAKYKKKQKAYRDNLDDAYIKRVIRNNDKRLNGIELPQSMIDFKRTLLEVKRRVKLNKLNQRLKDE